MTPAVSPGDARPTHVSSFRAPWWLRGAHAQTIGGKLFRRPPAVPLRRERWELPDGDFVDLDHPPAAPGDAPLVLVLHGLEGAADRSYMRLTYAALRDAGLTAVGLNFRSCSGEPNRAPRFYHSGDTDDLRHVLDTLRQRQPGRPIGAVGFSLGGNVLLKYLGEEGDASVIAAAVAVSVPFDLSAGADALEATPMGRFYASYFLRMLRRKAELKRGDLAGRCDVEGAIRARTIRAFDEAATAPLHGFADAEDYYRRSSSRRFLAAIRVPTLLLHSADDPFLPERFIPRSVIASNPVLEGVITEAGGHVGFITGTPWRPRFWAETEAARFLAGRLLD